MRVSVLFGPVAELATIRPPGAPDKWRDLTAEQLEKARKGSYADTRRFLEDCREAGVSALTEDHKNFATPLGLALLKLWQWCEESESRGIPYHEAVMARNASIERERGATAESIAETARRAAAARSERDPKTKARGKADELFGYADETIR